MTDCLPLSLVFLPLEHNWVLVALFYLYTCVPLEMYTMKERRPAAAPRNTQHTFTAATMVGAEPEPTCPYPDKHHDKMHNSNTFSRTSLWSHLEVLRNSRKLVILTLSILLMMCSYVYYEYIHSQTSPSLAYPLSQHNVDTFSQVAPYCTTPLHALHQSHGKGLLDHPNPIYGPLEQVPRDHYEPFNMHSLMLVASLFVLSLALLST